MWKNVEAGVLPDSLFGPLLFLICTNHLPENLVSNPKLFAADTSLFSEIPNELLSAQNLNEDLNKIDHRAFQWKIHFNPDLNTYLVCLKKSVYPPVHFNNILTQSTTQKRLVMLLDVKLDFQEHLKNIYSKANKTIGILRKLHNTLPIIALLKIYTSFS